MNPTERDRLIRLADEWDARADSCVNSAMIAASSVARQKLLGRGEAYEKAAAQLRSVLRLTPKP